MMYNVFIFIGQMKKCKSMICGFADRTSVTIEFS
jgi:hypothetical protein